MLVHVFKAQLMGWSEDVETIMFDANRYSKEEAESNFIERNGITNKNGYDFPYTYYECGGKKYHKYYYVGVEDRDVSHSESF
jgi:hypothetical protein